jgi:hypothetical protein
MVDELLVLPVFKPLCPNLGNYPFKIVWHKMQEKVILRHATRGWRPILSWLPWWKRRLRRGLRSRGWILNLAGLRL